MRPGRALLPGLVGLLLLGGCTRDIPPPQPKPDPPAGPVLVAYSPDLEPAAAVLPLVPDAATTLVVTDFDDVRLLLGQAGLTGASPQAERDAFWAAAKAQAPALSLGILAPFEGALAPFGITRDDVSWEAGFGTESGAAAAADGAGTGYVLKFRDDLDMAAVQSAVDAGVGPLAGATVVAETHLAMLGTAPDPADSWGASDELVGLVGASADSTYVRKGCVSSAGADAAAAALPSRSRVADVDAFSFQLSGSIATARLTGTDRTDLFIRMRLSLGDDGDVGPFPRAFTDGVADPSSGRIGFAVTDNGRAVQLTRQGDLPVAVCAPD